MNCVIENPTAEHWIKVRTQRAGVLHGSHQNGTRTHKTLWYYRLQFWTLLRYCNNSLKMSHSAPRGLRSGPELLPHRAPPRLSPCLVWPFLCQWPWLWPCQDTSPASAQFLQRRAK